MLNEGILCTSKEQRGLAAESTLFNQPAWNNHVRTLIESSILMTIDGFLMLAAILLISANRTSEGKSLVTRIAAADIAATRRGLVQYNTVTAAASRYR